MCHQGHIKGQQGVALDDMVYVMTRMARQMEEVRACIEHAAGQGGVKQDKGGGAHIQRRTHVQDARRHKHLLLSDVLVLPGETWSVCVVLLVLCCICMYVTAGGH